MWGWGWVGLCRGGVGLCGGGVGPHVAYLWACFLHYSLCTYACTSHDQLCDELYSLPV